MLLHSRCTLPPLLALHTVVCSFAWLVSRPDLASGAPARSAPPMSLAQLPAVRVPAGDDAVWLAVDGHVLHVAWGDDAPFERVQGVRPDSSRRSSEAATNDLDGFDEDHRVEDRGASRESDATADGLRAGLLDDSTLVLVDAGGNMSTLPRGSNVLEAAADLDASLDLSTLREIAAGACSETGRWPTLELGLVTWMPWSACADFVRCAPLRPMGHPRRPVGLRVSLTIRGALTSATDRATSVVAEPSMPFADGRSLREDHANGAFGRGVAATSEPSVVADSDAAEPSETARRVTGLVSLLLTLRFDPRALARERLAQSLTLRRDTTPLGADVVDALGAETARALICEGAP